MAGEKLGRHFDTTSPRGYYLDYSRHADSVEADETGVLVALPRGGSTAYSPLVIARAALGSLEIYLGGGRGGTRDRFELLSRWLIDNIEVVPGSFGGWSMPESRRGQKLQDGWFSGLAHAECLSVLVRAASLLRQDGALEAARRAFGGFCTGVGDGGFLREIGDAGDEGGLASLVFVEEYPLQERSRLSLATHVSALWAVFDYLTVTDDHAARLILGRLVDGLAFVLERFDMGYWAAAELDDDLRGVCPASAGELATHILMLDVLQRMTGRDEFGEAALRWRGYSQSARAGLRARLVRAGAALTNLGASSGPQ